MSKKLYRSRADRLIGGVCGGIAKYFAIDPLLVRLVFILIFLARGAGFLAYLVAWIIIPEEPTYRSHPYDEEEEISIEVEIEEGKGDAEDKFFGEIVVEDTNKDRQKLLGIALVVLGFIFFIDNWFPFFRWDKFWPIVIIILGFALLYKGVRDRG